MDSSYVDEREDVQKKTFTKWINSQLVKAGRGGITELFSELRDGEALLALLEVLTARSYRRERGRMRVHHVNNVNTALRVVEASGVRLVNISAADVVDGNPKLILGLVWSIIVRWQGRRGPAGEAGEAGGAAGPATGGALEAALLGWARARSAGYERAHAADLTRALADGLVLNALLHSARPTLFRYEDLLPLDPDRRLQHAFDVAHQHFNIPKLLDPEDVNTASPDKKSIMTYLMCLYQSLGAPDSPDSPDERDNLADRVSAATPASPTSPASPDSPASASPDWVMCSVEGESSGCESEQSSEEEGEGEEGEGEGEDGPAVETGELARYGGALEEVLAWLLAQEERLAAGEAEEAEAGEQDEAAGEAGTARALLSAKRRFHSHEQFLVELCSGQARVGGAVGLGARLVRGGGLRRGEAREVRLQARLLRQRWAALRRAALEAQARRHAALMAAQQGALAAFRRWLTHTEDRMSRLDPASAALTDVLALHRDLAAQQPLVDALADCVVVVDADADNDADAGVAEIEDSLRALGERWTHACQWTGAAAGRARLTALAAGTEAALKALEAAPAGEVGAVLARQAAVRQAARQLARAARLAGTLPPGPDLEPLQDRLDAMAHLVQVQAQRIREMGFEFELDSGEEEEEPPVEELLAAPEPDEGSRSKKPRLEGPAPEDDIRKGSALP